MYYSGMGVQRDYAEVAKWTRRAAEQGYARAQTDLGYLYENGKGVSLDYVSAYRWYRLAAQGGDKRSRERLKSLARVMTAQQIREAKAANLEGPRALSSVNQTFRHERGVTFDDYLEQQRKFLMFWKENLR